MLKLWRAFARNTKGATAIEYGLVVALIFVAIIVSVNFAASATISMWTNIANRVVGA